MNNGPGSGPVLTIDKPNLAAMSAGNLLREREANATAFRLCGVKGHKEIFSVGDAKPAVFNAHYKIRLRNAPSDADRLGAISQ